MSLPRPGATHVRYRGAIACSSYPLPLPPCLQPLANTPTLLFPRSTLFATATPSVAAEVALEGCESTVSDGEPHLVAIGAKRAEIEASEGMRARRGKDGDGRRLPFVPFRSCKQRVPMYWTNWDEIVRLEARSAALGAKRQKKAKTASTTILHSPASPSVTSHLCEDDEAGVSNEGRRKQRVKERRTLRPISLCQS
jgi:hypothetical protein